MINGVPAWTGETYVEGFGEKQMGRLLKPAATHEASMAAE